MWHLGPPGLKKSFLLFTKHRKLKCCQLKTKHKQSIPLQAVMGNWKGQRPNSLILCLERIYSSDQKKKKRNKSTPLKYPIKVEIEAVPALARSLHILLHLVPPPADAVLIVIAAVAVFHHHADWNLSGSKACLSVQPSFPQSSSVHLQLVSCRKLYVLCSEHRPPREPLWQENK